METLATKTATDLALQGSGWACAVLLGLWSLYLFRELRTCDKRVQDLLERTIVVAESGKAAATATAIAVEGLKNAVAANVQATQDLAREAEGEAREGRHGVANVMQVVQTNLELLRNVQSVLGLIQAALEAVRGSDARRRE